MQTRTVAVLVEWLVVAAVITGCTVGAGDVSIESRDARGFDEVVLLGSGDVSIQVTGTESVQMEAEENILPLLTADVVDGRLELGSSSSFTTRGRSRTRSQPPT